MEKHGLVFDIQRCSLYDGPGIRTTVFLKGCPLRCKWCHNPESQSIHPQMGFFADQCVSCGACTAVCPKGCHTLTDGIHLADFHGCIGCGACAAACPNEALKLYGRQMTAGEVAAIVKKDLPYYEDGGGVTVSGGEPFMQTDFLAELLRLCKESGIHTAVETCGYTSRNNLERVMDNIDLFLYDYKLTDPALHRFYTGVDPRLILENLDFLYRSGKKIIIRGPIIPGVNANAGHYHGIAALEQKYPDLVGMEFLPYHNIGKTKADAIGKAYEIMEPSVDKAQLEAITAEMRTCGCSDRTVDALAGQIG